MSMRPYDARPVLPRGMLLELLVEARFIPSGATVRKRTGQATHTLVRRIRIYPGKKGMEEEVPSHVDGKNGCVFLEGGGHEGTFNVYPGSTKFVWLVSLGDLVDQVKWQEHSRSCK